MERFVLFGNYSEDALTKRVPFRDEHLARLSKLKEQGKLQAAINSYQHALKLNPNYPEAHYNLGIALKWQGNLQDAIDSYQQALKINPNFAEFHNNIGIAFKEQVNLQNWAEFEEKHPSTFKAMYQFWVSKNNLTTKTI